MKRGYANSNIMKKETLLQKGFTETPHLVLGAVFVLDVGRNRYISIASLATPNEVAFLNQKDHNSGITDLVCIHNFDHDGYLTEAKLDTIISIFA